MSFFPRADAALLSSEQKPLPVRPTHIAPIFDPDNFDKPIGPWSPLEESCSYPQKPDLYAPSAIPDEPTCPSSRYLRCHLAKNERLRLSMLWYYTRDILDDPELLAGLQEKANLAQEATGWEFAVIGILDVNLYVRLTTVGLELGNLPRGETLCAHTVTQPPGSVFLLPNMMEDWRFRDCPYVESGGLTAYAGVPLRMLHESGETVGLGSLCVASRKSEDPLAKPEQQTLARLGDWIVSDLVKCAKARRQRERHRMSELIAEAQRETEDAMSEEPILRIMRTIYPGSAITLQSSRAERIEGDGQHPIFLSDVENGLWEDIAYIDEFIANSNHQEPPSDRVVRMMAARCESTMGPSLLVVATKDFRLIFDDVDSWFVQTCASMLSHIWQKRLLSEVMMAKEKFLRGVSHQLRTPVHGILGAAELLAEGLKACDLLGSSLEPASKEMVEPEASPSKPALYLDTITTAGRDLMSIVNSMITLNRWADIAIADRQYATHSICDLEAELAKGVREATSGDTRVKVSVFFNYDLPPGCDSLRIDINLLRDSLLPLITNAIQNTAEGNVVVSMSVRQGSNELVVDIEDNGCGIHPDDHMRIFEPYEKVGVHSTGAGLGLTLATKFATLHHGFVEMVSSDINHGSHFRATFRDVDCTRSPLSWQPMASKLKNTPSNFHHMTSDSEGTSLCSNLAKHLIRNGFTPSDSVEGSIIMLDFVPDFEQRRAYLSKVPPEQVAICLVPGSDTTGYLEPRFDNVVYVSGPFMASTIGSALEEADRRLSKKSFPPELLVQVDERLPSPPTNDEGSTSDEGYGSMGDTPPSVTVDTSVDGTAPSVDQSEVTSPLDLCEAPPPMMSVLAPPSKPRALLVDDNVVNLRILQMYCKKRGLPYCCATDGEQAVAMFSEYQSLSTAGKGPAIQLVLMDLQMPVCDGIEATRQIRDLEKKRKWKASSLFIITGQDSPADRAAADGAGADEYLVKPVGMKLLDHGLKRYFPGFEAG